MKYNFQDKIQNLANEMNEVYFNGGNSEVEELLQFTKDDLLNSMDIMRPIMVSFLRKNSELGDNRDERIKNIATLFGKYKSSIESLIGFEIQIKDRNTSTLKVRTV